MIRSAKLLLLLLLVIDLPAQTIQLAQTPTPSPSPLNQLSLTNWNHVYAVLSKEIFEIRGKHGSVIIHLDTGKAEFSGNITPDEAAKTFWLAVESLRHQQAVEELRSAGTIAR
ncbi:MAG: hypothetical protein V7609_2091 [Verrucomicrobiota bacterium]